MSNILIRDTPSDVHSKLQERAEGDGRSLQQYLIIELRRLAERPTMDEVLDRIDGRSGGRVGLEQAALDLAEDRSSH